MADNEALISQFMDVTGIQRDRAEFFLQSANYQLDVALSSFYEESVDEPPAPISKSPESSDEDNNVVESAKGKKVSSGYRNFATMSSVREPEKEGDEKGQAFYAGGSEHSGLQVLGPPKKNPIKDMVSEVFRQAQSGNLEQFDSSQEGEPSFRSFTGVGNRLGQTEDDTVKVPSGSGRKTKQDDHETVTVKVYRQGFTVDDGDLRSYEDPQNREFFESITRNEIPSELRKQGKSMVHVNVENHLGDDYVKKVPKFKAFTGSGHTLGSPTPLTAEDVPKTTESARDPKANNAENEARAVSNLNVNQEQPTTMISIRLNDGSRLSARFNLTHTIQDIRQYIMTARPEYSERNFTLLTTFPNKELTNPDDTVQQAGLQNAAILQRLK